ICSATTRATLRSTPNSRSTFAQGGRRFLRCGARTIPSFCLPAQKPSNATTRTPKSVCSMPVILRSRVAAPRSQRSSATSSPARKRGLSSLERSASMAMSQTMDKMDHTLVTRAELQWSPAPAVLPAGAQSAVLYGDPNKEGLFSMRFKLPKDYRVAPHTLSKAGLFTVISGTFRIGMGEKADPSKAKAMPTGSFIPLAPATPHYVAVDEETVVQLNNIGPWVITYIDPKDDPRQKPKYPCDLRGVHRDMWRNKTWWPGTA